MLVTLKSFVFFSLDLRAGIDGMTGQYSFTFGGCGERDLLSGMGGFTPGDVVATCTSPVPLSFSSFFDSFSSTFS